jgi:cytochrome c peroxidase
MFWSKSYYSFLLIGAIILPFFMLQCKTNGSTVLTIDEIIVPKDNPMSAEKIALGKSLFFDKRLSNDETISCATCHVPAFAFTDRKKVSEGVLGRKTQRNSPSLLNAGFLKTMMFDAHLTTLEMQVIVPVQEHVEMDMKMQDLIARLRKVEYYQNSAKKIFNRDFDAYVLTRSISSFERSLVSQNSRFDQFYYGKNKKAITKDEKNGWLIFSEKLYCTKCHPAPHFTNFNAQNNGLYSEYGEDKGRFRIFNDSMDIGKFKVPSLRNIELTFPYMHDGSMSTIESVIDHYKAGGKKHPLQSSLIQPFTLSTKETYQLKKFLFSLTDTSYLENYR